MTLQIEGLLQVLRPLGFADIDWTRIFNWERIVPGFLQLVLILLVSGFGYRLVKLLTRRMEREITEDDPLVKRMREQRAKTMASLLNNVALIVIIAVAGITVLGTFGVRIEALLASVGIVGLAISFGAQSLVKDVINGTFILLEGQFGIGDVIRAGDTSGMVEKLTLRTTTLRDLHGTVHIIPNGEITRISNLTKTWSRAVLDIGVAYKEDVDRVISLMRQIGLELHADPKWSALFLDEPEVLGVDAFADSSVVIRLTARTLPQKQWEVSRELRRRIKNRFDAEGVEIPFPHVTFYWGEHQVPPALAAGRSTEGDRPSDLSGARGSEGA